MATAYNVFVTYERSDRAIAKQLAEALVREGLSVWSDNDITAGEDWPVAIEEALNRSGSVVVLWSKRSIKSKFVRNEARQGDQRGILVPAFLEKVRPPFEFDHVQAENLIGWREGVPKIFYDWWRRFGHDHSLPLLAGQRYLRVLSARLRKSPRQARAWHCSRSR